MTAVLILEKQLSGDSIPLFELAGIRTFVREQFRLHPGVELMAVEITNRESGEIETWTFHREVGWPLERGQESFYEEWDRLTVDAGKRREGLS